MLNNKLKKFYQKLLIVVPILALLIATGCTEKRPETFLQGHGKDLFLITDYEGKVMQIKTGKSSVNVQTSSAEKTFVDEGIDKLNNFGAVEYTGSPEVLRFLGGVTIRGRTNFTYEIRLQLTEKDLRVLKIGYPKDIPAQEHPYATKLGDGRIAVPLLGYSLYGYFRTECVLDVDNECTSKQRETSELNPEPSLPL